MKTKNELVEDLVKAAETITIQAREIERLNARVRQLEATR